MLTAYIFIKGLGFKHDHVFPITFENLDGKRHFNSHHICYQFKGLKDTCKIPRHVSEFRSVSRHALPPTSYAVLEARSSHSQEAPEYVCAPSSTHSLESTEVELVGVVPEEDLAAVVSVGAAGHQVQRGRGRPDDPVLLQPHVPGVQDRLNHELKLHSRETHGGHGDRGLCL